MADDPKQTLIDFHQCFDTEHGKRVIKNLKKNCQFDESPRPKDNMGRIDPYAVMYREGQRSVIIHIERILRKDM